MKRQLFILLAFCVAATSFAKEISTESPLYFRADLGYNFFNKPSAKTASEADDDYVAVNATNRKVSNDYGYTLGLGYQLTPEFRSDLTLTHRPNINYQLADDVGDLAKGKLRNYTLMLNGYYDFNLNSLTPYVTAGIGFSRNATGRLSCNGVYELGKANNQLAWQAGAGIAYAVSERVKLDFNYQYVDLNTFRNSGKFSYGDTEVPSSWAKLHSNQVQAGIRYYL